MSKCLMCKKIIGFDSTFCSNKCKEQYKEKDTVFLDETVSNDDSQGILLED